jgi:phenylpropionate dioxygenase-like ring-hydroxylating dioxygenase large terminal subunit
MSIADPVALNQWHVVAAFPELPIGRPRRTQLLDADLTLIRDQAGTVSALRGDARLPVLIRFGYVWTSLGAPPADIFDIPEYAEPDRRNMSGGSVGLHVSAPRAVENFLDLGHFAFVHTNYLGVEPHTEIKPYTVMVANGEVVATNCRAWQPMASIAATEGFEVDYVYRVPHPFCAVLYKTNVVDPARRDVIGLFMQPVEQERSVAHLLVSYLDDVSSDTALKGFQQLIFAQDKPILENQVPKRLPLSLRAEISAKADASSAAYRRWLSDCGVQYGTIPA